MSHGQHVPSANFPTTHWSLVRRAGQSDEDARREALTRLLLLYMPPLRSHLVLRKRINADRAEDLLQGFITDKLCQQQIVAEADAGRGKFRTFLLTVLDRYVISVIRAEKAGIRSPGGGATVVSDDAAMDVSQESSDVFDVAWARQALAEALRRMRLECEAEGRPDVWGVFDGRILRDTRGEEPMEYDELVRRYALGSPAQASNVLITAKRAFTRHLRATLAEYAKGAEIDQEMNDLMNILAGSRAQ